MESLRLACDACTKPIDGAHPGGLHISLAEVSTAEVSMREWRERHPELAIDTEALGEMPEGAKWRLTHHTCVRVMEYGLDWAQLSTVPDLLDSIAHLFEKTWVHETDLTDLIRRIGRAQAASFGTSPDVAPGELGADVGPMARIEAFALAILDIPDSPAAVQRGARKLASDIRAVFADTRQAVELLDRWLAAHPDEPGGALIAKARELLTGTPG